MLAGALALTLALLQSRGGCGGYEPEPRKGAGEPCTRSDECQSHLECRGGVCMDPFEPVEDSGVDPLDSGVAPADAGLDAGAGDAGDGGAGDGGAEDASVTGDAGPDSGASDAG